MTRALKSIAAIAGMAHRRLVLAEKILLCLLLFSMILISFAQVVMRNIFSFGFVWINDMLRVEVIWIAFIGASLAAEYGRHLRIDILPHLLKSPRLQRATDAAANAFTAAVSILLLIAAVQYIALIKPHSAASPLLNISEWIFRLVIPYAFAAMAVRCIVYIFKKRDTTKEET
ncbi:MAG: TRAP transporter small permease [Thermodesulfobacteriota bacterium]|nr:TRAP transporter small permease [Thermodesulfobacteriota bacterium]